MSVSTLRTLQPSVLNPAQKKRIGEVPTEVWSRICEFLPIANLIPFMLVARRFHDIGAYEAYKVLVINGAPGRRCCASLACGSTLAAYYLSLIRDLTYYAVDVSDRDVSLPLFARILPLMPNIHTLGIHLSPHTSSFFMYCLDRRIVKKPNFFSVYTPKNQRTLLHLPYLRRLTLNGSPSLLPLAPFKNLSHFEMTVFQNSKSLVNALLKFDNDPGVSIRMRTIRLRFHHKVDIVSAANAISDMLPRLEHIVYEQPGLNVKAFLNHLVKTEVYPNLRAIHLNVTDRFPKYWTNDHPESVMHRVLPMLAKIAQTRDQFRLITFGRVGWMFKKGKFVQLPKVLFDNPAWYGNTLIANKTIVRVWCKLNHEM